MRWTLPPLPSPPPITPGGRREGACAGPLLSGERKRYGRGASGSVTGEAGGRRDAASAGPLLSGERRREGRGERRRGRRRRDRRSPPEA